MLRRLRTFQKPAATIVSPEKSSISGNEPTKKKAMKV
jgi:hypothetical protein